MVNNFKRGPLLSAGLLLGIGLGGLLDGIVLHQILQTHNMLSNKVPVDSLVNAKVNMTWDGYFHAMVWLITAIGVIRLFNAAKRDDVVWSGKLLFGAWLAGWGLFNLVEGIVNHYVLELHHVMEYAINKPTYDLAFLVFSVLLMLIGWVFIRGGSHHRITRSRLD